MADISKALKIVRKLSPSGFFSRAAEAAQEIPQVKGTPEQMRKMLLDRKGVKPEELKWTGFDEWAKGKKSVTRDEITEFLRRNEVQVGEKTLSGDVKTIQSRIDGLENTRQNRNWTDAEEAEYRRLVNILNDDNAPIPNFEKYTLPGGENYRELLLTRPRVDKTIPELEAEMGFTRPLTNEQQDAVIARWKQYTPESADYTSSHFPDTPNPIAHMRMKERVDPEGRRVLHLEELQSDWAQEGRKTGFRNEQAIADYDAKLAEGRRRVDEAENAVEAFRKENPYPRFEPGRMTPREYEALTAQHDEMLRTQNPEFASLLQNMRKAREQLRDLQLASPDRSGVPSAPFVESTPGWTNLALKRAMIEAARGNYDAIAWTPGREQAKRYDLSQHVREIEYIPNGDGTYRLGVTSMQGEGVPLPNAARMTLEDIERSVGKEIAEKIKSGEGRQYRGHEGRTLEGLDLQVGGQGMVGYYDKILPTQISKVLKDIGETPQFGNVSIARGNVRASGDDIMNALPETRDMNEAQRSAWWQSLDPQRRDQLFADYRAGSMELPSFNITPEMRAKINQGLPLFTMMPAAIGLGAAQMQERAPVEGSNPAVEPQTTEPERREFQGGGRTEMTPEEYNRALEAAKDVLRQQLREQISAANANPPKMTNRVPPQRVPPLGAPIAVGPGRIGEEPAPSEPAAPATPAVSAAPAAARQESPVERAMAVVRNVPRAAYEMVASPVATAQNVAKKIFSGDNYQSTGEPVTSNGRVNWGDPDSAADFFRADAALQELRPYREEGFADGGHVEHALRLIQDEYPTQYLPNVGRQVMADGGSTMEGFMPPTPDETPDDRGERWQAALRNYRNFPVRPGEATLKPADISARDYFAQAIAGEGGPSYGSELRKRAANLLVGSRGLPDTGIGFGVADAPMITGIPLQALDIADATRRGDYGEAALGAALPVAFWARKPLMSAGRRAVEVAGDVLGRVPAPVAAGAAGAAVMTPQEAEASPAKALVRATKKALAPAVEVAGGKSSRPYRSPTQQVDATLDQPSENVLFRGKDPANWTPQDWHDFGKQYGVSNLGPANQKEWEKGLVPYRTISGREITLPPGGYASDEPFTYYDLLHLKSQGINPNDLPPDVHQAIHNRMVRSMQPGPEGPTNEQITNQMIFGLISPNQPLTPNELALQRAMVKGPQDVEAWGRMIPYRYTGEIPPVSERQAISREITPRLGLHAAERGGIGASGSANYTDIAEFVQKMRDKPNFYRFNPNDPSFEGMSDAEKWATHVGRVMNATRGLKAKTGSLASVWQSPETAAISAIDRHMATKFRGDMFPSTDAKAAWEANVVAKYNEARPDAAVRSIDEMLAAPGGRGHFVDSALAYVNNLPAAVTRSARTGEYNPSIPVGLRDLDWPGGEPRKMEMVAGPYVRALEANAEEARRAGQGLFSNQWMLWDRIRNRLEPHEILFPGLEKLPRMSLEQMRRVTKDLSEAGYMAAEGGVRPLPSASRAGYFTIPPILAGGAALLSPEEAAAAEAGLPPERRDGGAVAKHAIMLAKEIGSSPRETKPFNLAARGTPR